MYLEFSNGVETQVGLSWRSEYHGDIVRTAVGDSQAEHLIHSHVAHGLNESEDLIQREMVSFRREEYGSGY
jgi:hypothetical protein